MEERGKNHPNEQGKNRDLPSNTPMASTGPVRGSSGHRDSHMTQFGADFISLDVEEFREEENIPGKRKHDQLEKRVGDHRQPKLARYEDGSFTTPWMTNMPTEPPENAAQLLVP